jgi:hypothetical protein
LWLYRVFVQVYIDDFVIYSKLFRDHVTHLTSIFSLCREKRIHLKPLKTYLNYLNVQFLRKYVNSLGFITVTEKIEAIQKFKFLKTLAALKRYLGVTGWMKEYVQDYAIKVRFLQDRKTKLLAVNPRKGKERMHYSLLTAINDLTEKEIEAFRVIQKNFKNPI